MMKNSIILTFIVCWSKASECRAKGLNVTAPASNCIDCICGVESHGNLPGCGTIKGDAKCGPGCRMDVGSCSCGPFQIKQPYFTDCSKAASLPITDWKKCSTDESCARKCVIAYLNLYGSRCTGKTTGITCEEYGGIHNGGPRGCNSPKTEGYRKLIQKCCSKNYCFKTWIKDHL